MNVTEFAKFLFDRDTDGIEWYFRNDHEELKLSSFEAVGLFSELFANIRLYADGFTEKQACMGLRYVINPSCSLLVYSLLDNAVPQAHRQVAISSMVNAFDEIFSVHCKRLTPYHASSDNGAFTYGELCYMWWDIFPRHGVPRSTELEGIDDTIIETIAKILIIDNISCKESALHGLGHWYNARPYQVESLIQNALAVIPNVLMAYAGEAIKGGIQ